MFHLEDVLQIKDIEEVRALVRRHPLTLTPSLAAATLLIVVPFFFIFPLFRWGIAGMVIFLVAVISGIILAIRTFLLWNSNVLIITSLRLVGVDQRGVFSRFVVETPLTYVAEVTWQRQGLVDACFKTGTICIRYGQERAQIELERVSHPERVITLVNDLCQVSAPNKSDVQSDERKEKVMERFKQLSVEELEQLYQKLEQGNEPKVEAPVVLPMVQQKDLGGETRLTNLEPEV
jgi:hypothetical protein